MPASWSSITQKVVSSRSSGAGSSATRSVTCGFQTGGAWAYKETAGDIGGVGMMVQVEGVGDDADLMLPGALARFFLLNRPMLRGGPRGGGGGTNEESRVWCPETRNSALRRQRRRGSISRGEGCLYTSCGVVRRFSGPISSR